MKSLITTVVFCFAVAQTQPTVAQALPTTAQTLTTTTQALTTTVQSQPTTTDAQSSNGQKLTVADKLNINGTVRAKYEYQPEEGGTF